MNTENLFIALLCSEISQNRIKDVLPSSLSDDEIAALLALAKKNALSPIIYNALLKLKLFRTDDEAKKWRALLMHFAFRIEKLSFEAEKISNALEAAKIAHVPLKGAVLRHLYPEPWMRTSCDIDILVREDDLERTASLLATELGYAVGKKDDHDILLTSSGGIALELHFTLNQNLINTNPVLNKVWSYASPVSGREFAHRFSDEFLLFHLIAHTAKHFRAGGCGVIPFIDLYILRKKLSFDPGKLSSLFDEGGFEKFFTHSCALSDVWFGGAEHTKITLEMQSFVFRAGVSETESNHTAVAIKKSGGKLRHVMKRLFMPFSLLRIRYPVLLKYPFLAPFCSIHRIATTLTGRGIKHTGNELQLINRIDNEESEISFNLFTELDLLQ